MTIDDLRQFIDSLPDGMPVLLFDQDTAWLIDPEFNVEAVTADLRMVAYTGNGETSLEALVIS